MSFQMLLACASFYLFTLGLLLPVFLHFGAGRQTTQKWPSRNQSPTIIIIRIVYLVQQRSFYTVYPSFSRPGVHTYKNTEAERESNTIPCVCVCVCWAGGSSRFSAQIRRAGGVIWRTKSINPGKAAGSCSGQPIFADTRSLFYRLPSQAPAQPIPAGFPTQ